MKQIKTRLSMAYWAFLSVFVLSFVLMPWAVSARELTEQQVKAAVQTWVRHVTADPKPDAVIGEMEPITEDQETVGYIVHLQGGGFSLAGADDQVLPVYLYSPCGKYDPANSSLQVVLTEIRARVRAHRKVSVLDQVESQLQPIYREELSRRAAQWQDLIAGHIPQKATTKDAPVGGSGDPDMMELPLTSRWAQGFPHYNDNCPVLIPSHDDTRVAAGCAPVAMAQVMYYWKWPNTGEGSTNGEGWYPRYHSDAWVASDMTVGTDPNIRADFASGLGQGQILKWDSNDKKLYMRGYWDISMYDSARNVSTDQTYRDALTDLFFNHYPPEFEYLSADFGATTYNWNLMQQDESPDNPPDAGTAEVAKIINHAGIAGFAKYGIWRTGGDTKSGKGITMVNYFRYDPHYLWSQSPSAEGVTEEIQWLRPVIFGHPDHSWVGYGYNKATDPNRQFKMNMGWGGCTSEVWYSFDCLNVKVPDPEKGCTFHCYSVSFYDSRIAPLNVVKFVGNVIAGDGSPGNPYFDFNDAIYNAPDNATLIFKAGSVHTPSIRTITKPLTLKGYDVLIQ